MVTKIVAEKDYSWIRWLYGYSRALIAALLVFGPLKCSEGETMCSETTIEAGSPWNGVRILGSVIPLVSGSSGSDCRIEGDRLIVEADGRALALGFWPGLEAERRGGDKKWHHTDRWADEFLAAWPWLGPSLKPYRDPGAALRKGLGADVRWRGDDTGTDGSYWPCSVYLNTIPAAHRNAASGYIDRRFHLLRMFAFDERLIELAGSNPGLAYALSAAWRFYPARDAGTDGSGRQPMIPSGISGWKRRKIAAWLGFPDTGAAVRILKRIEPQALTVQALLGLRKRMMAGGVALSPLRRLDAATLRVLADPRLEALASPRLLSELGSVCGGSCMLCGQVCPVRVLARMKGLSRALGDGKPRGPFSSLAQLEREYRALVERLRERDWRGKTSLPSRDFPPPPFPGNSAIEPIRTEAGLYAEGLAMGNCLPDHRFEARSGRRSFYRVLAPERATLMLERSGDDGRGPWVPGDIRGVRNAALPAWYAERCFRRLFESATVDGWLPDLGSRYRVTQAELPW